MAFLFFYMGKFVFLPKINNHMSDLLQDYKDYYRVRAERYAGNPNYKNSYEAEKNLSEAMQGCSELEEFRDRIGNLNELCAVALVKDKNIMENAFYKEFQEVVRAAVSERILEKADQFTAVFDLINMVNTEETRGMREISLDEANRIFHHCWMYLDRLEIYSQAVVPAEYESDMKKMISYYTDSIRESVKNMEEQMNLLDPAWRHNPNVVTEYRHRRLLPYKEEHIIEQLSKYKQLINQ